MGRDSAGRFAKGGGGGGGGGVGGGMSVASFFGMLGLKVDRDAWKEGQKQIDGMKTAVLGLGAYFGARALGSALISYNANLEDARNQIAGMLALSKKTDLADQYASADSLVENLRKRASKLPGTTAEYISMLGMLTQPLISAGLGLQDLEDLTVNATVGAKALKVEWEVAARDIDQAIRGQFHSVDQFTGKILGSMGFVGEEGRKKFNAMSQAQRAATLKAALSQKQLTQLAEAQGKTFRGVWSTFVDAVEQFLGKVGLPLFKALGTAIGAVNAYLEDNAETLRAIADVIGSAIAGAFEILKAVFGFLISGTDEANAVLAGIAVGIMTLVLPALLSMAAGWVAALWPVVAVAAVVTGIILLVKKLGPLIRRALGDAWDWVKTRAEIAVDTIIAGFDKVKDFVVGVGVAIKDAFLDAFAFVHAKIEDIKLVLYEFARSLGKSDFGKQMGFGSLGEAATWVDASGFGPKGGAPILEARAREKAGLPALPAAGPTPGGGGVNANANVTQTITVTAGPDMDEKMLAKVIGEAAAKEFTAAWRNIADNRGVPK